MTVFAGIPGWNQAICFHCRWYRFLDAVKDDLHQLTSTGRLSPDKSGRTRANVAFHAEDSRVGRTFMRSKFRLHHMAGLATELSSLHVVYSAVSTLRSDHNIECSG